VTSDEELRLCRSHLTNRSPQDVRYELETDGIDGSRLVPPAIFHTLVENAITHGPAAARVTLRLRERRDGARIEYVFEAPAEESGAPSRAGGGTRYIEARLREAWGDAWSFRQERAGPLWRVSIAVPA
jgi:LytS/YehU family sensor histidine kinase